MHGIFRKKIFGSLHVSPTSDKYKENKVILDYRDKLEKLNGELYQNKVNFDRQVEKNRSIESDLRTLNEKFRHKENLISKLKNELKAKNEFNRFFE